MCSITEFGVSFWGVSALEYSYRERGVRDLAGVSLYAQTVRFKSLGTEWYYLSAYRWYQVDGKWKVVVTKKRKENQ